MTPTGTASAAEADARPASAAPAQPPAAGDGAGSGTGSGAGAAGAFAERSPTCPTANPPPGTGSQIGSADAAEIVRAHNEARREAIKKYNPGLPLLSVAWDPKIACDAQAWADDPASSAGGTLHHSSRATNGDQGENLFHAWPGPARPTMALDPSLDYSWTAEKPEFDADNNAPINDNNYRVWGHYSQMVWMSPASPTTAIGCGVKEGVPVSGRTGWILVCRYSAAGNITGQRAIPTGSVPAPVEPTNQQPLRDTTAVAQREGHLDVFWIGPDGSVRSHWWDGASPDGTWAKHSSFSITPPNSAAPNSGIATVAQRDGHLDVFWIGPDGSVRSHWWDSNAPDGPWAKHNSFSITPPNSAAPNSGITAVAQRDGHLDVFWIGPDGSVRSHWWDSNAPDGPWAKHNSFSITPPNSAAPNSGIATVAQRDGHLDVFWIGPDGSVRSHWWDSNAPDGPWAKHNSFDIAPPNSAVAGSTVAAVAQRDGHLDVFWIGPDGSVRSHWWDSRSPDGPWAKHSSFSITPPNSAAPNSGIATVAQRDGHLDVFWIGPDGSVRSHWWDGASPDGPWAKHSSFSITPPNSAAPNSGIATVAQRDGHLDVFWIGPDGSVRSHWWDSNAPDGPWAKHNSFDIAPPNSAR
ncbi:CAP domain-containing protein [Streptomyces sp. NPDC012769]|uniref:CAP domain-containing protein n=1 Tax=Streptomyces sp. NPDC012769 TaxID=3364848 RepID=UPI00367F248E